MLQEGTFSTGTVDLHYAATPGDGPPLLFLHGIMSRWQSWLNIMPAFALRWQVHALDFRGHGLSGRTPGAYRAVDYAGDVITYVRERIGRPTVIVGHSLGAIVTVAVASDAPDLVRAAVLEDPPLGAFSDQSLSVRPENSRFRASYDLVRQGLSRAELEAQLAVLHPDFEAAGRRSRAMTLSCLDPDVLGMVLNDRAKEGYDLDRRLGLITVPTLLLQGNEAHGGALDDERARHAAALLRDCAHVYFAGAGHGIKEAQPAEYVRVINAFLESL
jgi:pimeloyl-ACP methyl ester carboxylesterase